MNDDRTTSILLDLAIGLDAVALATALATFAPDETSIVLGSFTLAIMLTLRVRGIHAALASVVFTMLALPLAFEALLDLRGIVAFGLAAALLCVLIELLRTRVAGAGELVSLPSPLIPREQALPLLRGTALPLLALVIYTNISDVAIRNLGTPSILQPLIAVLAVAVWHYRRALGAATIVAQPLTAALAAFCVVLVVSSLWAPDAALADDRIIDALKNLAIFIVAASLAASWNAIRRTIAVLTASGAALAAITMLQSLTNDSSRDYFGFGRIQEGHIYDSVVRLRPSGPVGDPNFYAQLLLMVVPLAVFAALAEKRALRRALLLAGAALIAAGTVLTYSRGAMVALAIVAILVLITLRVRMRHVAVLPAVAVVGWLLLPAELKTRLLTIEALTPGAAVQTDSSMQKRQLLFATALRMFDDHPVGGVGAGNFARAFPRYANDVGSSARQYDDPGVRQFPHSLYVEIAAENGLLGIVTFGAVIAAAYAGLHRARRRLLARHDVTHAGLVAGLAIALTAYLLTSLFLHGSFLRYLWLLLALVAAVSHLGVAESETDEIPAPEVRSPLSPSEAAHT